MIQASRLSDRRSHLTDLLCDAKLSRADRALRHKVWHRGDGDHETAAPSRPHVHAACGRRGRARLGRADGAAVVRLFPARADLQLSGAHLEGECERDLSQGNTRTIAARSGLQIADYYAPLVRKYRRAMWRRGFPSTTSPRSSTPPARLRRDPSAIARQPVTHPSGLPRMVTVEAPLRRVTCHVVKAPRVSHLAADRVGLIVGVLVEEMHLAAGRELPRPMPSTPRTQRRKF